MPLSPTRARFRSVLVAANGKRCGSQANKRRRAARSNCQHQGTAESITLLPRHFQYDDCSTIAIVCKRCRIRLLAWMNDAAATRLVRDTWVSAAGRRKDRADWCSLHFIRSFPPTIVELMNGKAPPPTNRDAALFPRRCHLSLTDRHYGRNAFAPSLIKSCHGCI